MKRRTRNHYTDAQKAVMWARWMEGWTFHQIAHRSIVRIRRSAEFWRPPDRSRAAVALTLTDREAISRAMAEGRLIRSVASLLGRACRPPVGRSAETAAAVHTGP